MSSAVVKAVLGGFVADAASMPTHWIYDREKLKEVLGKEGMKTPAFFKTPSCPFYSSKEFIGHYEHGMSSPYGEQGEMVLKFLEKNNGSIDSGRQFSDYLYEWGMSFTGRKDHATKLFLEAAEKMKSESADANIFPVAGADDEQANCFFKVAPIFARYGGSDDCAQKVDWVIRAHQNNDKTVHFALAFNMMLDHLLIKGNDMDRAISAICKETSGLCEEVRAATKKGWDARTKANISDDGWDYDLVKYGNDLSTEIYNAKKGKDPNLPETYSKIMALTCAFPQSYFCALKIVGDTIETIGSPSDNNDFKEEAFAFAVQRNINYGGDTCGRSYLIGSLIAALGAEIPDEWIALTRNAENISQVSAMLESKNPKLSSL
mmetsp:Transcript_14693/g.16757  ORF Transcript_14693/g.16757 Transcript_14693/m.16757 type:complete len:376 (-) Transcript_14693:3660-4787(-)